MTARDIPTELLAKTVAEVLGVGADELAGQALAELGGSSLDAGRLAVALLREHDVQVTAVELLQAVDLEALLGGLTRAAAIVAEPAGLRPGDKVPLTWQQRVMWFHSRLNPESTQYHFSALLHFERPPSLAALRQALADALRARPLMRIRVESSAEGAWQVVPPSEVDPAALDVAELSLPERPATRRELVVAAGGDEPFDLEAGRLLRWRLVRFPDGSATLVHSEHHLIHDGIAYLSFLDSLERPGEPDLRYFQYALGQTAPEKALVREIAQACLERDLSRFTGGGKEDGTPDIAIRVPLPGQLWAAVRQAARQAGVSAFAACFTAFADAVARHQGRSRLILGTGAENRPPGFSDSDGMFVSLTPVFVEREPGEKLLDQLKRTSAALYSAVERAEVPLHEVIRELGKAARGGNALVSAGFSLFEQIRTGVTVAGETARVEVGVFPGVAKFPIDGVLVISDTGAEVLLEADSSVMSEDDVWAVWSYLIDWLRRFTGEVAEPQPAVSQIVLRALAHAAEAGDRVALSDAAEALTYAELAALGSHAASVIRAGQTVALVGSASTRFYAAAFGMLHAGACYVPVDADQPIERARHMLRQAGCDSVVDLAPATGVAAALAEELGLHRLEWTDLSPATSGDAEVIAPRSTATPAYVMYTSGSTGVPKGVVALRPAVDLLSAWASDLWELGPGSHAGQWANVGFDGSVLEVWSGIWGGATIHIAPSALRSDPPGLARWLGEHAETIFVTSVIAELLMQLDWPEGRLRLVATGGDRLHPVPEGLPFRVLNMYGPTEATAITTAIWTEPGSPEMPPIGRALPYAYLRVVSEDGAELPEGGVGELWIGGPGVCAGYAGDELLSAAKFIPDPYAPDGAPVYRTGDIVRSGPDGVHRFVRRRDRQIKVAGVRFELGEIEAIALRQPGVRLAVAHAVHSAVGDKLEARPRLYAVAAPGSSHEELAAGIREALPPYLRHIMIRFVEALPVTANGKVDLSLLSG